RRLALRRDRIVLERSEVQDRRPQIAVKARQCRPRDIPLAVEQQPAAAGCGCETDGEYCHTHQPVHLRVLAKGRSDAEQDAEKRKQVTQRRSYPPDEQSSTGSYRLD